LQPAARALTAFFLVAAASLGGSLFLVHERSANPPVSADADNVAASSVAALFAPHGADQRLLDTAFSKVEDAYYRPVMAQPLLDGERKELIHVLKLHHVTDPNVPELMATGVRVHDEDALNTTLRTAERAYGDKVDETELTQAAVRGMLGSLGDPYTTYLSATEINSLEESLRGGDFEGIGVYIVQDPRTKQILIDPIDGMPAARAGLMPGDVIVSVDGQPTDGMKLETVEREIRGRAGTVVHLVVVPHLQKNTRTVAVTRGRILVPSVYAKRDGDLEYVRLSDFGSTSYDEVRKAMLNGKEHGARGYILDLRNNGGGLLDAAVDISSLFVNGGEVVSTIDRAGTRDSRTTTHAALGATPLVVLVNAYTASASEITAGAIQDHHVGTLVGTKTFGKGVVQSIYTLGDGGALKITTARYLTPNGRDIHHRGIEPDVLVEQPIEPQIIGTSRDKQLAKAKDLLERVAGR
jgi:carboxyl-terminal processing protease